MFVLINYFYKSIITETDLHLQCVIKYINNKKVTIFYFLFTKYGIKIKKMLFTLRPTNILKLRLRGQCYGLLDRKNNFCLYV